MDTLPISISDVIDLIALAHNKYTIKVNEVECLVLDFQGYQVVIPRGTEFEGFFDEGGWRDVIRDLRTLPWPSKRLGGWSHAGFLKGARGIVDKGLAGMLRKTEPTLLIGHSLGGALAVNVAGLLASMGFLIVGVITLGSPRTFTKGTVKKFKQHDIPVWQFSNPGDPVTDVPFRFWQYRHINEIKTDREPDGYSISGNHSLPYYKEALT